MTQRMKKTQISLNYDEKNSLFSPTPTELADKALG